MSSTEVHAGEVEGLYQAIADQAIKTWREAFDQPRSDPPHRSFEHDAEDQLANSISVAFNSLSDEEKDHLNTALLCARASKAIPSKATTAKEQQA